MFRPRWGSESISFEALRGVIEKLRAPRTQPPVPPAQSANQNANPEPPVKHKRPAAENDSSLPIEFSEDLHISNIRFEKNVSAHGGGDRNSLPTIFEGAKTWQDVPKFAVITGVTGSGKTQLLKYINDNCGRRGGDVAKQVLYISVDQQLGSQSYGGEQDTSNFLNDLNNTYQKCVEEILAYYLNKTEPSNRFSRLVVKNIEQDPNNTNRKTDKKYIEEMVQKTIDYEANDLRLVAPISFLTYIFLQYERRKDVLRTRAEKIAEAMPLFNYYDNLTGAQLEDFRARYKASMPTPKLDLQGFFEKMNADENFKKSIIEVYANFRAGPSPLENMNAILEKYGFKYRVKLQPVQNSNAPSLVFVKNELVISPQALSSGELLILSIMAWQYYAQGLSATNEAHNKQLDNRVKIMLFDEPDKNLDPRLCRLFYHIVYEEIVRRHNIQVIMTTHRLDTVALAPSDNIYRIYNKGQGAYLAKVHKLEALFGMTYNLRDIMDNCHKVYTESTPDADFYTGAYAALKELSDQIRAKRAMIGEKNYDWVFGRETKRLLSKRYQPSFESVSKTNQEGNDQSDGGCILVINSMLRDWTAMEHLAKGRKTGTNNIASSSSRWLQTHQLCSDPRLYRSFGILDEDYGKDYKLAENGIEDYTVVLHARHSLENYLLDPIIFCSTLTEQEIRLCIENSNIKTKEPDPQNQEWERQLKLACFAIKQLLQKNNYTALQPHLDIYFSVILQMMCKFYDKGGKKEKSRSLGPAANIYANMKRKINGALPLCDVRLTFVAANNQSFVLNYPQEFLKVRGHDFEDLYLGKKNLHNPTGLIASKVYENGLQFIPEDLAEIFFKLDEKIRANVRAVTKPNEIENLSTAVARVAINSKEGEQLTPPKKMKLTQGKNASPHFFNNGMDVSMTNSSNSVNSHPQSRRLSSKDQSGTAGSAVMLGFTPATTE